MNLTEVKIRSAKPRRKAYRISDGDGLYLAISPQGKKRWHLRYRFGDVERMMSLGRYPDISLSEARERRLSAKKQLEGNIDPCTAKRRQKAQAVLRDRNSFALVAEEWFNARKGEWSPRHARKIWHRLETYVFPDLGKIAVADIQPLEVLRVIQKIEARDATEMSGRQLAICSRIFKYAVVTGRLRYNPASDLREELRRHRPKHHPHLRDVELPEFLAALERFNGRAIQKIGVKLLLLTALRTAELRKSKWENVRFDLNEWQPPAAIMKMRETHIVPLSRQARALLERLHKLTGHQEWLFPATSARKRPFLHENFVNNIIEELGFKGRVVGHGFRATFSTIVNQAGFNRDAIERQLAHQESNQVRRAYNHAEYLHERRTIMQWWADYLDACLAPMAKLGKNPVNVLDFPANHALPQPRRLGILPAFNPPIPFTPANWQHSQDL